VYAELARAAIRAAEVEAREFGSGVWFPNGEPLAQLRAILPTWFPRVNEILRLLGSHNLLATPTAAQLADPGLRPLLDKYLQGAKGFPAEERVRLFRLAWDFAASALGSRNEQYERFYLASGARNMGLSHILGSKDRAARLVDRFLREKPE
jgi:aromatic ring hydroxylase